ncbi:MAG: isoprenylcysteine carboxyl methyltransferase, partial [Gammaproteobacteria bacterium]|nr:isoprenylcysteine carboxyl methyltransferase [Gammaproteobacteria bacterium]
YRYVRNPMYVGGIAVLLGAGLALRSPGIMILAFVAFTISHLFVVYYEEPTLAGMFDDSYARYNASVSRWLPGRPKPSDFSATRP